MASFVEDLWNSIFTPGPTPTLLIATNATFAVLQVLLLLLLVATYSIHFLILSVLSGGLWVAINWFARELQAERSKQQDVAHTGAREKSLDPDSETETEATPSSSRSFPPASTPQSSAPASFLRPQAGASEEMLRKRRSLGESSGYVSTDSEWEKISEEGDKTK